MVNFFIGRPIFATVLALLMLLIGGICIFVLPISQYPQITPAQVQVTTTYTGADAQTVAETVTTPIEQQINGVKGMIYFSSDSTSNGLSNIVATFDVGYSQDIAAVDIQNRVQTAEAALPPEVKQFGVTSQREVEHAVATAIEQRKLQGSETLKARAVLEIDGLGTVATVDGTIALS